MPIDYKEYPPNWKSEIRPAVLKRAGNCCENCGVKNHSIIHRYGKGVNDWRYWPEGMEGEAMFADGDKPTKIVLTVAHLDHDKSNANVSLDRLRAWCQKCHLGYDMNHHVRNRKYGRKHTSNNLKLDL